MTENWKEWLTDPFTKAWFHALEQEEIAAVRELLGSGGTLKPTVDETALQTARMVGVQEGLERAQLFVPKRAYEEGEDL